MTKNQSSTSPISYLLRGGAIFFLLTAVLARVLFTSIPTRLGLYSYIASRYPMWVGMTPAFSHGVEPSYTFEQLYKDNDLTGKTALVTGANSGIGFEISLALARLGASVILACRNEQRCNDAAEKIRADGKVTGNIDTKIVDFSSLRSVKDFSIDFKTSTDKLDLLFMNAGIGTAGVAKDGTSPLSVDGIEKVFATNLVGHHLLWKYLEPLMKENDYSRVVLTSSAAGFHANHIATNIEELNSMHVEDDPFLFYAQTKLGQIYWAQESTRQLGPWTRFSHIRKCLSSRLREHANLGY